jgi:predicted DNA-binding protein (MmcQ/YjbR family)
MNEPAGNDALLDFCRSMPAVTEDIKWENNRVFSVGGKMFAIFNFPDGEPFSFKTDPHVFADLTQREGIQPAPYLARALWVLCGGVDVLPLEEIKELLLEAHAIVVSRLPRRTRAELGINA